MQDNKLYRIGFAIGIYSSNGASALERAGFDLIYFKKELITSPIQIRNGIIREEYNKRICHGDDKEKIINDLTHEYKLSVEYLPDVLRGKI